MPEARRQLIDSVGSYWLWELLDDAEPSVRLVAVKALRRALPGQDDNAYVRTVSRCRSAANRPQRRRISSC